GGLYMSRDGGDTWKQLGPHPKSGLSRDRQGAVPEPLPDGRGSAEGGGPKEAPGKGLPDGIWGKIGLAVASDGHRIYALIEAEKGGLYRSDDGGDTWTLINGQHYLRIRPWYFSTIAVNPHHADVIYASSLRLLKSTDGGATFKQVKGTHHVDHHDLWIDPKNPKRMIDSNDGGVD